MLDRSTWWVNPSITSIHVKFRDEVLTAYRTRICLLLVLKPAGATLSGRHAPICYSLFAKRLPPFLSDFVETGLLQIGGSHSNSKFDLSVESEEPWFG